MARHMGRLLRTVEALRLYVILLTTPYAILWADATHSGGWVMVVVHALLVLCYALSLDLAAQRAGMDPRLSLTPDGLRPKPRQAPRQTPIGCSLRCRPVTSVMSQTWAS